MRNPVARHDHNRASVHPDRSKKAPITACEGLLEYYAQNAEDVAQRVYKDSCDHVVLARGKNNHRVIGMSPDDSKIVPMVEDCKTIPMTKEDIMEFIDSLRKYD